MAAGSLDEKVKSPLGSLVGFGGLVTMVVSGARLSKQPEMPPEGAAVWPAAPRVAR